jgi:hypothetical protein
MRKIMTIISVDVRQSGSYLNPGNPDLEAMLQINQNFGTKTKVPVSIADFGQRFESQTSRIQNRRS